MFPDYKKVKVKDLIPYARNARLHSEEQITKVAASIKEFGFLNPVILDGENGIIAGHCRVLAAKKLGIKELPAIEAIHLTETQKKAYIIADNKLAEGSTWDNELLKIEFEELQEAGFDVELTGFVLDEIDGLCLDGEGTNEEPESSTEEIDVDEYKMDHTCPKCGFEYND